MCLFWTLIQFSFACFFYAVSQTVSLAIEPCHTFPNFIKTCLWQYCWWWFFKWPKLLICNIPVTYTEIRACLASTHHQFVLLMLRNLIFHLNKTLLHRQSIHPHLKPTNKPLQPTTAHAKPFKLLKRTNWLSQNVSPGLKKTPKLAFRF